MKVQFIFREGKPEKSGSYLTVSFNPESGNWYSVKDVFYNAKTGRWNDYGGSGEYAFDVDMWAEIPKKLRKEVK